MSRRKKEKRGRGAQAYTALGHRMRSLGKQTELGKVMKLSQQTVSKKIRGDVEVFVSDLEKLAKHYVVPMAWFFLDSIREPLEAAKERIERLMGHAGETGRQLAMPNVIWLEALLADGRYKDED